MSLDNNTETTTSGSVSKYDQMAELLLDKETPPLKDEVEEEPKEEALSDEVEEESNDETDEKPNEEETTEEVDTWAKALGVDESKLVIDEKTGVVKGIVVKVGDSTETVDINSLIRGYQTDKYNTQKSQVLSEDRKELDIVTKQASEAYIKKLSDSEKLVEYLYNTFISDYRDIDWERLRQENPAEYAAIKSDFSSKQTEFQTLYSAIEQSKNEEYTELQKTNVNKFQEYTKQQADKVLQNNPEWSNPEKLKDGISKIAKFVNEAYGFSEQEFYNVADARIIEVLKDAMKYRNGVKVADNKLSKPLPKFIKPQSKPVKTVSKVEQLTKQAKNAKGNAKRDLESSAIAALLMGE